MYERRSDLYVSTVLSAIAAVVAAGVVLPGRDVDPMTAAASYFAAIVAAILVGATVFLLVGFLIVDDAEGDGDA